MAKSTLKQLITATSFTLMTLGVAVAENNTSIAMVEDAKVFAQYTDEKPYVVNYYSLLSEQEIVDFYVAQWGEIVFEERKRGRLLLKFNHDDSNKRMIISPQNNRNQVDILIH